jgi:hypothetical protein
MLTVRPQDLPALRGDLARYRAAVTALEREALAGIAQWRRPARRPAGGRKT